MNVGVPRVKLRDPAVGILLLVRKKRLPWCVRAVGSPLRNFGCVNCPDQSNRNRAPYGVRLFWTGGSLLCELGRLCIAGWGMLMEEMNHQFPAEFQ